MLVAEGDFDGFAWIIQGQSHIFKTNSKDVTEGLEMQAAHLELE